MSARKEDRRKFWGGLVSLFYLTGMAIALIRELVDWQKMDTLSQWGDFLAGGFAPLAFLWLVIGYLQQSDELKQNTEALVLQARALEQQSAELRQSVEQQVTIAESSRLQATIANRERDERREREALDVVPKLVFSFSGIRGGALFVIHDYKMRNVGGAASSIALEVTGPITDYSPKKIPYLNKNEAFDLNINFGSEPPECHLKLEIQYKDKKETYSTVSYVINTDNNEIAEIS